MFYEATLIKPPLGLTKQGLNSPTKMW